MMRWFKFSVEDYYENEDTAFRLDCIIDDLVDKGEIIEANGHGASNWEVLCTKETFLTMLDRLYSGEYSDVSFEDEEES